MDYNLKFKLYYAVKKNCEIRDKLESKGLTVTYTELHSI